MTPPDVYAKDAIATLIALLRLIPNEGKRYEAFGLLMLDINEGIKRCHSTAEEKFVPAPETKSSGEELSPSGSVPQTESARP